MSILKTLRRSKADPMIVCLWIAALAALAAGGQYYYLRYRCGRGTVSLTHDDRQALVEFRHGDDLDGEIELGEFLALAGVRFIAEGGDTS